MTQYLGDFAEDDVIYVVFNTFTSDDPSASCTITNFVNTDIHIHKDDGLTQRNNAAGITVSVDFDGITGSHLIKIDTNDNTVAGFWLAGHDYFVRMEGTSIDGATVNSIIGHFSIENRYMVGTNSAALASALTTHDGKLDTVDGLADNCWSVLSHGTYGLQEIDLTLKNPGYGLENLKTIIDTIDGIVDAILIDTGTTLHDMIVRILGLEHENAFIDNTTYTGVHLTGARVRIYSVAGSVGTASDVIATYTMTANYTGDEMDDYKLVKV